MSLSVLAGVHCLHPHPCLATSQTPSIPNPPTTGLLTPPQSHVSFHCWKHVRRHWPHTTWIMGDKQWSGREKGEIKPLSSWFHVAASAAEMWFVCLYSLSLWSKCNWQPGTDLQRPEPTGALRTQLAQPVGMLRSPERSQMLFHGTHIFHEQIDDLKNKQTLIHNYEPTHSLSVRGNE